MSTHCRTCHAPVVWARTAFNGTPIPIDVEPAENGNIVLSQRDGNRLVATVLPPGDALIPVETTYTSHFATCPDADQWRNRHHA